MGAIEIVGVPQKRSAIRRRLAIPEREDDPVHPDLHGEIDRRSKTSPYAGQDRAMFPVMVTEVDDENAAGIQARTAIAVEFR